MLGYAVSERMSVTNRFGSQKLSEGVYIEAEAQFQVCRDKEYKVRRFGTVGRGLEKQKVLHPA